MRLVKRLDIFIVKQFALLFIGTFFICQFVLMMQFLWRYVEDLIGKGLSLDVLAKFFWYMGLILIPQALPLAILLSSLITFGNLGESSELTAIKAAGISLMQSMRSLIVIVIIISGVSLYFQNVIGPEANKSFAQLLLSMKQKSPELEIPEGAFYDGLPQTNIYVQKKDIKTGMLYDVMIYRQTGSYDDQAIILADSAKLQSTAEKKHLLLTLWSGEWFENMKQQDLGNIAEVPYRRETFTYKEIVLDFDGEFNLADASAFSDNAKTKSAQQIIHDLDSIRHYNDSIGRQFYREAQNFIFYEDPLKKEDSVALVKVGKEELPNIDTLFSHLSADEKREVMKSASRQSQSAVSDLSFKSEMAYSMHRQERTHQLEVIGKFTLALSCIIFFFIGAPLGAIIRKGGLGVPVIISVIVFIIYYIFENSGMRMARDDNWTVWYGRSLSTMILAPLAVFFTYKANNDSAVFNADAYRLFFMRVFGLRQKRNIAKKEVVIYDPDYQKDANELTAISAAIDQYSEEHHLLHWPNPLKVFFRPGDDRRIIEINDQLETVIEDLSNTGDRHILHYLNTYPVVATHAHTRPFRRRWLNALTGIILPVGIFFYIRMLRFRLRLFKDLKTIEKTNHLIITHINSH